MFPFGVTIPATVPQRSEITEGLMNYPICMYVCVCVCIVESENLNCRDSSQDLSSDTIQIDKEIGGENVDWLYLGQDRTTVMNLRFP